MPRRRSDDAMFLLSCLAAGALLFHFRHFYHDDAYITLRYVSRLLAGKGLTWTDGERVEGYTHPLWLGQIALLGATGVPLVTATRISGLLYLAALFALWRRSGANVLLLVLVATQPGLLLWTLGGLETAGFCFLLALGVFLWAPYLPGPAPEEGAGGRRGLLGGLAFAGAALTRPEGVGVGVLALGLLWLAGRSRRRLLLNGALAFSIPVAAYSIFRLMYFHDLLATSARAKLEGIPFAIRLHSGLDYLGSTLWLWMPAGIVVSALLVLSGSRRALWAATLALPLLLGILLGGGDHMPGMRLLVPPVVLLAFVAALGTGSRNAVREAKRPLAERAVAAVACTVLSIAAAGWQVRECLATPGAKDPAAEVGATVGSYLEANLPAGALVAASTAGSTPFAAPSLRFIDMLGLNDPVIARRRISGFRTAWQHRPGHWKGNGAYVLRRRPDVVILGPAQGFLGSRPAAWFLTDLELLEDPVFRANYVPYGFLAPIDPGSAADPALRPLLAPDGNRLVLVAYLRHDSAAAAVLAQEGRKLAPPWSRPEQDPARAAPP